MGHFCFHHSPSGGNRVKRARNAKTKINLTNLTYLTKKGEIKDKIKIPNKM